MSEVATYDAGQVAIAFGPNLLSGTAEGSFVTASRNNPGFTVYEGADGEVARAANRSKTGTVKVKLASTSKSNDVLSAIYLLDEASPGAGVLPLMVKDGTGTSRAAARSAWIAKMPDLEKARTIGEVEWEFGCKGLMIFVGGTD